VALYALIGAVLGVLLRRALVVSLVYAIAIDGMIANLTGKTSRLSIPYWLRSLAVDMTVETWSRIRSLTMLPAKLASHDEAATRLVWIAVFLVVVGARLVRRKQYVLTS